MNRSIEEVKQHFDAKRDTDDFAALDYLYNNRPLTLAEYDTFFWDGVERDMEFDIGHDILEIGSGVGFGLSKLEGRANRLVGTDISANLLKRYKGKAEILPIAAHEIDFPPQSFDRIFMVSVSVLFPDFEYFKTVVHKAIEQLRVGGILGIFDQHLHTKDPHPRYLSLDRCELSHYLDDLCFPYSIKAQNRIKRRVSNRFDLLIYKD
jgi:predicted TPR repeat methyltransferase